jgi:FKBP-type peptidyl-prolyl cis-trans isomerase FklB
MPTTPEGRAWLAANAQADGVVVLPSGLQYKVLQASEQANLSPLSETPCECHYRGTLIDGTEFDSSHKRGKPRKFSPSQVIAGWTEAMELMAEGDRWQLFVPAELAYGDSHRGAFITPGAVLIFELELISVQGSVVAKTAIVHTAASRAALMEPLNGPPPPHAVQGKRVQIIGLESKPEFKYRRRDANPSLSHRH